jgi:glycine/sarcosine N-methyltransferase
MDQFNSEFANHWDELVGWEKRSSTEIAFLMSLLKKFNCRSVLDVALGTGFHSVELLKQGLRVKSVDVSPAMIKVANQNAKRHSVTLDMVCADWAELDRKIPQKFDCILCLGNSLACEMNSAKRQQAVHNWVNVLSENGIIIVDRRNYESLLSHNYNLSAKGQYSGKTVKITPTKVTSDGTVFSYTFSDGKTFDLSMYPLLDSQINELFRKVNYRPIEVYGDQEPSRLGKDVSFYIYIFGRTKDA